ncbi:TetR/AcrR family transcriptional regulator [Weissella kandleri]|uniref:TetR/AcrR family transcriptional regulator n=1 Tax=Weissella kandleri TaxID=1616 RepID=UPI00387EC93F
MSRTKEFNKDEVLEQAMNVFWKQGYANTSMQELVNAMQINRGSIYATFGDKHALFVYVLDFYHRYLEKEMFEATKQSNDLGSQLNDIFNVFLKINDKFQIKGCLIVNSATELGQIDSEIKKIIEDYMHQELNFILNILDRGRSELCKNTQLESIAKRFQIALIGMRVSASIGASESELKSIAEDVIETLPWKRTEV